MNPPVPQFYQDRLSPDEIQDIFTRFQLLREALKLPMADPPKA